MSPLEPERVELEDESLRGGWRGQQREGPSDNTENLHVIYLVAEDADRQRDCYLPQMPKDPLGIPQPKSVHKWSHRKKLSCGIPEEYAFPGSPCSSPPRGQPRDFRGGLSVFSSHPDLVPPRCLFGKQALCPQPWWFILEFLPEHAQWPNRIALLAIPLLLWTSQFLPVCLVPLFTCPHDIPGQSPTALWTCCYHNLFISWSPFLSALATLPHTHASRDHHAHQALFSRTYRLLSCSRPPSSKSRRGF